MGTPTMNEAATIPEVLSSESAAAPSTRDAIIAALTKIAALQGLTPEEYGWLADHGE